MTTIEYKTKTSTSSSSSQRNGHYPQISVEPLSVLSRTKIVTTTSARLNRQASNTTNQPLNQTYVTDDVYAMPGRNRFIANNQEQFQHNEVRYNENLPPSSPPFRNHGTPLFQHRNRQTNHNRSGSWDLLPPPSDSEASVISEDSLALPVYTKNRFKDRELFRKLATSTEAILPSSFRSRFDENMTTLQPGFNEDFVDPNTPSFERNLLKAAQRDIDQSTYEAVKKGTFRGTGSSVGSNSEEGGESRKDLKARRLMEKLISHGGPRAQRPASASDINTGKGDDAILDINEMRRSLSSSSTDSRRRGRVSPILALGAYSPSRRRRLGKSFTESAIVHGSTHPTVQNSDLKENAALNASIQLASQIRDDTERDETVTTTIDWLAIAKSAPAEDIPNIRQPRDRQNKTGIKGADDPNGLFDHHSDQLHKVNNLALRSSPSKQSSDLQNIPTQWQRNNVAKFPSISVIDEMTEPPTSSPATYQVQRRDNESNNQSTLISQRNQAANTSWLDTNDADETRDVLRQISRAGSHSPPEYSREASTVRQNGTHGQVEIKEEQEDVSRNTFLNDSSLVDISTDKAGRKSTRSSPWKNGDHQTIRNNKSNETSIGNRPMHNPIGLRSHHVNSQVSSHNGHNMGPQSKITAAWPGTPNHHQQRDQTPRTSASRKSLLRSPSLSDFEDLEDFKTSPPRLDRSQALLKPLAHKPTSTSKEPPHHHSHTETLSNQQSATNDISLTIDEDAEYHTDDSLDRLLANDTDFSSLLRKERFDDESFLLASTIDVEPSRPSTEQRQKELAVQARLLSRLQTLQFEIRAARKGIEVIERKIAFEDGEEIDSLSGEVQGNEDEDYNDVVLGTARLSSPVKRVQQGSRTLRSMLRWPYGYIEWSLVICLITISIVLFEFKLWSDTIIPEYSTISSDEWFAIHPPGQYKPGVTFRFFASLLLVVLTLVWSCFRKLYSAASYVFGGIRWVEHIVMNQIMPPPIILEDFPKPDIPPVIVEEITRVFS